MYISYDCILFGTYVYNIILCMFTSSSVCLCAILYCNFVLIILLLSDVIEMGAFFSVIIKLTGMK